MNDYELKQEAKRERYLDRSAKADQNSINLHEQGRKAVEHIPFGQPILVGHHSESKHRNALKRAQSAATKSVEEGKKADYYASKAASVGTGGVSSDDPDAVVKLKEKLLKLEASQALMKKVNSAHRAFKKNPATLDKADISDKMKDAVRAYKQQYSWEPTLFPPYATKNNNANIRSTKKRIDQLLEAAAHVDVKQEHDGFTYLEEDNRIQFVFDGKPSAEIRTILKSKAFKWSPTRGSWVRMLNNGSRYAAEGVINKLRLVG